ILVGGGRGFRISAANEMPLAVNWLQKTAKTAKWSAGSSSSYRGLDRSRVVLVEPAQGVGRAVGGSAPFGVAGRLRWAVAHVEAGLVGARHLLQPGDARQAQLLGTPQRRRR